MQDDRDQSSSLPAGSNGEEPELPEGSERFQNPAAFNIPAVILISVAVLVSVHLLRVIWLTPSDDEALLFAFAFFPVRFDSFFMERYGDAFPGGTLGAFSTSVTYSFLHADWLHLTVNMFWMLVFGSALARRFGAVRFLLLSLIGSVAGAGLHLATNWGSSAPVVGASAAISAHMACAARFAFVPYGPLGRPRSDHPGAFFLPALSIADMFKNSQVVSFLAIWFAVNLLFGVGTGLGGGSAVAWQAHIGGFLAGLLLFPLIDPVERA